MKITIPPAERSRGMSDIVERLRERPCRYANETEDQAKERRQREREEGANEIERLRAALRGIANRRDYQLPSSQDIARAALGEKA